PQGAIAVMRLPPDLRRRPPGRRRRRHRRSPTPRGARRAVRRRPVSTALPYGSWPSPITAASLVEHAVSLGQLEVDGDRVYWLEGRPTEGGRQVVVRWAPTTSSWSTPLLAANRPSSWPVPTSSPLLGSAPTDNGWRGCAGAIPTCRGTAPSSGPRSSAAPAWPGPCASPVGPTSRCLSLAGAPM